jgi:hypothetical protein
MVEGTRQISSVTSGEGARFLLFFNKGKVKVSKIGGSDCLIKTQDFAKC